MHGSPFTGRDSLSVGTILAIETSCDETAVAILRGNDLLASEVASQTEHEAYGGVVPEIASRNHLLRAPHLLESAVKKAGIGLGEVDAFAATSGPGLASSLMIGASIAKGLALGFAKPYLAINHLEGHLLSPFFTGDFKIEPNVSLIVSGGHTLLVEVRGANDYRILGRTVDDAAGEAFDKVAKMLGLGYPGGPEVERCALSGDAARFDFPRSMLDSGDHNFSFSGLKTAVRYRLADLGAISDETRNNLCASFQRAVVEVLVKKTLRAAREAGAQLVTISGGVSCNQALRTEMKEACERGEVRLLIAPPRLCTDNAAMIAFATSLRLAAGHRSEVTQEIDPNLPLAESPTLMA
ncbi:MAG TPA: tRNA (adenosine(37)-N6)-threonylcarbamoyltransferase complex transferase subunit TsaD [Chthoniobacterales bacterium]|nr:tRNA (adenosine(37)-N6)-threonylcarbamoyltransferase complex transferase subunit TsaD [Chthoniobacterales bacterium]